MSSPVPQLLLVKYLFQKGQKSLAEKGPYSAGLAVSLFQDAVELMARMVAKEVDAAIADKTAFEALWDAVNAASKKPQNAVLLFKGKLLVLNKARVGFKHYGILPDAGHVSRFEGDVEQFLATACKDFFGLDFKDVSLIDLIQHKRASECLREGQMAIVRNDSGKALEECAKAISYFGRPFAVTLPPLDRSLTSGSTGGDPTRRFLQSAFRAVGNNFDGLRDFVMVNSLGISLVDFVRLKLILPSAVMCMNGEFSIQWFAKRPSTLEDAEFALNFVTDYGLAVQEFFGGLTEKDRSMLFGDGA